MKTYILSLATLALFSLEAQFQHKTSIVVLDENNNEVYKSEEETEVDS